VTALTAASLAAWSLLSATTPTPKRTPVPITDASNAGRELAFLDLDRVKFLVMPEWPTF
jgi:hypothetical protein